MMHGGGSGQFSAIPLNTTKTHDAYADYLINGHWSKAAATEASKYLKVNTVIPDLPKFTSTGFNQILKCSSK